MPIAPKQNDKRQLAERIHRILEGGDISKDSSYDIREIEDTVGDIISEIMYQRIFSNYKYEGEFHPGQLLVTFNNVKVYRNKDRKNTYAYIPAEYLNLPGGRGVWNVGAEGDVNCRFIPRRPGSEHFIGFRGAPDMQNNISYRVEGDKVIFMKDIYNMGVDEVQIQLVTSSDKKMNMIIPEDIKAEVIRQVINIYGGTPPEDKVTDENSENR